MRMHAVLVLLALSSPALGQDDAAGPPPPVPRTPTPSPPGDAPRASAQATNPPAESPRPPAEAPRPPQTVTLQVQPPPAAAPPQTVTLNLAPAAPPPPQTVTLNLQPAAPPPQQVTLQIVPAPAPAVVAAAPVAVPVAAAPAVTTTAARLWYPGPLRQAIGAFGEHLALQRMARVYVPVPAVADVAVQPALVRTVQVAAPQPVTYLRQADLPPLPAPVYASPQLAPAKHHLFRGLHGR